MQPVYNKAFASLRDSDTVGEAVRTMLDARMTDLPVVDGGGRLVGMFALASLLANLLPRGALMGGITDLAFVSDDIDTLRDRMRAIEDRPVAQFALAPAQVVHPDTSPAEIILLIHRGQNNVPVVADDGRLCGMASAREILEALRA